MMKTEMVGRLDNFIDDVVFYRNENGVRTNIPHRIIRHSPTGFDWGYGGSGPAEFALNILSVFIGQEKAEPLYQDFKREFIEGLHRKVGVIPRVWILDWIDAREEERKIIENGLASNREEARLYLDLESMESLD